MRNITEVIEKENMTTLTSQTHTKLDKLQTFPNRNKETNQESRMDIMTVPHFEQVFIKDSAA
jgi:hypothetical protein